MKTNKKIITATLIIFCSEFCQAQMVDATPEQWIVEHKKYINNTPYIFEGTVIKNNYRITGKSQALYTCIIQITKIFKGSPQLKLGSVKVVTAKYVKNGDQIDIPSDGGDMVPIGKGGTFIIFGRPSYSSWLNDSTTTDNTIRLTIMDCDYPVVISGKDDVSWEGTPQFKTKEDIYSFFKESGVTVQEEAK